MLHTILQGDGCCCELWNVLRSVFIVISSRCTSVQIIIKITTISTLYNSLIRSLSMATDTHTSKARKNDTSQTTNAPSWNTLPPELVAHIFSFLDWRQFHNVAQVCQAWKPIGEDLLSHVNKQSMLKITREFVMHYSRQLISNSSVVCCGCQRCGTFQWQNSV